MLRRDPLTVRRASCFERGRRRIAEEVLDDSRPLPWRQALALGAAELPGTDPWWIPILIRLLDAPAADLRAAAARGLSAIQAKSTIVNPAFWRDGAPARRTAEVDEWRIWWTSFRQDGLATWQEACPIRPPAQL